jgi:hypothetical protein
VAYFGVMTSSPEESLAHARKAVSGPPPARSLYSAVSGVHTAGHSRSIIAQFEFPPDVSWSDPRLINEARTQLDAKGEWRETRWPDSQDRVPPTFLLELAGLLQQRVPRAAGQYIYNERSYALEIEAAARQDQAGAGHSLPVRGMIRNQRTRWQANFLIWIEESGDSIVPARIQYQPRSFLRLTFEAVPA